MECVLALPAQKEGIVIEVSGKNKEQKGIGSYKSSNGRKKTSKMHQKVPNFKNDYGKKGVNWEENGDEIAVEKITSKRKRKRLKKHVNEPQGDDEKKVDTGFCCYGNEEKGDETVIGRIKSKHKRRSKNHEPLGERKVDAELCSYGSEENGHEIATEKIESERKRMSKKRKPHLGDNEQKIGPDLCSCSCDIRFVGDKLLSDGKIKSKQKKKKKTVEDEQRENGDDTETSKFILKRREPQCDNREKIDPELFCYGRDIGFVEDTLLIERKIKSKDKKKKKVVDHKLQEDDFAIGFVEDKLLVDGKIKSKEKRKKKLVDNKLQKNGGDTETSNFLLKKHEPEGDNRQKIDPDSCFYGFEIGFGEDNLLVDGKIKSKEKNKKKKAVKDKVKENGDDAETSKFILKKREPQGVNREKIDPELCCYGCDIGFLEDKLLVDGEVNSKVKKNRAGGEELRENGDDAEISKFILKKREPQCDNREKIDTELCCDGCDIGFVEDKLVVDGNIESKDKKKNVVDHKLQEDDFAIGFVEDKLLVDGKIKSKGKGKKKLVDNKLQKNGDDTETSNFILIKHEAQGDNMEKIDPDSCFYGFDIGFVEDNLLVDGKNKSKEKNKKKKVVKDKLRESGGDAETSKSVLMKCEPQGGIKEKINPESWSYCCDIGFIEDNLLKDGKIKSKKKTKKKGGDDETSKYILKKRERQGDIREKIDPELCCYGCDIGFVDDKLLVDEKVNSVEEELGENSDGAATSKFNPEKLGPEVHKHTVPFGVQYVSPYFHDDSAEKINAKSLDKESKSNPIALPTSAASRDLFEDQLKENGNEFKSIGIKSEKKKSNCQKTLFESDNARKVSPYFQNDNVELLLGIPP
ncbi:hypothetical protein VNO80_31661 [Phaseolus coccineus]|uniref:Uncharacterized protein n=1 Tax=Phaseolus coccineus TaxID=3886 RepID=A0AAN9L5T9_PHACN